MNDLSDPRICLTYIVIFWTDSLYIMTKQMNGFRDRVRMSPKGFKCLIVPKRLYNGQL